MMDEPYVLASQATQVFYVENKRHKNQYVVVKTKVRDVFDASIGPQSDEDDTYSFSESVPYNISTNQVVSDNLGQAWDDVEGMTIDVSIIFEGDLHKVNNLDDCKFIDDESDDEVDNEDEYTEDEQFCIFSGVFCIWMLQLLMKLYWYSRSEEHTSELQSRP